MTHAVTDHSSQPITVLHVDDDPDVSQLTATYLERQDDRITVKTAQNASEGLDELSQERFDCIVSDYDMPGLNGIEFLQNVRETHGDMPFILYTGKGSEEVASDAVSAGVTDYLQKQHGVQQYTILANRITNAVEQARARTDIQRMEEYYGTLLEHSLDYVMVVDADAKIEYISPAVERILGYSPAELRGGDPFEHVHPDDETTAMQAFLEVLDGESDQRTVEFRARHADGTWRWLEVRGRNRLDDPIINGILVNVRDVTAENRRRERVETQRQTLYELANDDAVAKGDFDTAVRRITEAAARVLDVQRVNVWLLQEHEDDADVLRCIDHYDQRTDKHDQGTELSTAAYPDYFRALETQQLVRSVDARNDPQTAELTDEYLIPNDIGALLDGTLRSEGETIGVVCHEHVGGPREWTEDESSFVSDIADIVHRAIRNKQRREREQELHRIERAMDAAPVGIVITDPNQPDNPITHVNDHFQEITGYDSEEIVGRNCRVLQGEHTAPEPVSTMREAIDAGEPVTVELINYRSDGTEFWNKVSIAPIHDEDGEIINFVGFQVDISARKEREQELKRTESRMEFALRASSAYIFEIDLDSGQEHRIGDWDSLHGLPQSEVSTTETFVERAVHPEDQERSQAFYDSLEPEPGATAEIEYRTHPDLGEVRWIRSTLEVQSDDGSGSLKAIGLATDVTDNKREQSRLNALFQNSVDAIVFAEYIDGKPVIRDVNTAFEATFGCEAEEVEGEPVDDIVLPDGSDSDAQAAELNRRIAAGERVTEEVRRKTTAGVREFLLQSTPLDPGESGHHTFAIYSDITQRKAYERALQGLHTASEAVFEAESPAEACEIIVEIASDVLDHPYVAVFLWDEEAQHLAPATVSEQGVEEFGEPPTFQPGDGLVGHVYQTEDAVILEDAQRDPRALETGSDAIRGYVLLPLGEHGVLAFGSPDAGGFDDEEIALVENLAAHARVALDRISREQTLLKREKTLERQNRQLQEFTSVVSHDLRSPLRVADGRLDLAREDCDSEHLDAVAQALDRTETLIEDMLSLARAGELIGEIEWLELSNLVECCWANVATDTADISIEASCRLEADESRLQQLLENLFRNAVEHGGSGVTVRVGDLPNGFYVEDDGPGIPEAARDDVFEAGHSTADGLGFGLNIVRKIAEAHGWDIRLVESDAGGARFEFTAVAVQ